MIYRTLGRTNYKVSAFGIGGFQLIGQFNVPPAEADSMIDYAIDKGVNLIDTAQAYGSGESEAIVGRALMRHTGSDRPFVCEKVGHLHQGILMGMKDKVLDAYHDPDQLIRTIKHSMWIMRVDVLDMLLIHEVEREWKTDFNTGDSVGMTVLEQLKKEGLVKYIGASSWDCSALAKVIRTDRIDLVMNAGGISLLTRWMFDELIPAAKEHQVGVITGGILGQNTPGLIFKNREALTDMRASGDVHQISMADKLEKLYDLSDELGLNMVQMAVRYVLSFPDIHSHVMGARSLDQIKDNLASVEMGPLDDATIQKINAIQDMGEHLTVKAHQFIK